MSDQITVTNTDTTTELFNVYYGVENRQKRIKWVTGGTGSGTTTVNLLYSALQNLFDELTQMDDGVPMSAQTPTEYTIGIIDAGDSDPWFIDRTTVEHLTGGALKTASWQRDLPGDGTGNIGIVKVTCNNTNIDANDIGLDITCTAGDDGTLLDVKGTGAGSILWIRPDTSALADDWDSTSGTITVTSTGHTATQSAAGVSDGESLWANIYSIGTIEINTHIYIYQNAANLVAYKAATDWWGDGHIDLLVNVKELGTESDEGYISVLARQYSKTYSYYTVDLTNGGRNPIPLQTGNDLDNQTGYWQMVLTTASDTFTDGEVIQDDSDSTIQGVVTSSTGTAPNITLQYYQIGDPQTNFGAGTGAFTGVTSTSTATAVAPTAVGPSNLSPAPTIRHGASATRLSSSDGGDFDIDENGTFENYSIVIDCVDTHALTTMYQWSKYATRRSETATTETDGVQGQFYIGSDYRITYTGAVTGTLDDADVVTQEVTGATGTIVYHNITDKIIILRNSRGTFVKETVAGNRTLSSPSGSVEVDVDPVAITPISAAPFGTFAGGKWFLAPGVVLDNYLSADLNNFQLVDDGGTVRVAPTKVNVTIGNTRVGDKVAAFRLTAAGGDIQKNYYTCVGGESAGGTTLVVNQAIRVDEPGKTAPGGVLRLVDSSTNTEYRMRFLSWTTSTFTLDSRTGLTAEGTSSTVLTDSGATFSTWGIKVGDLLRNTTEAVVAYVVSVDSETQLTTTAVTDWTGDAYQINTLPVAPEATNDTVYIPFIDAYETTGTDGTPGSETVLIVYDTVNGDVPVRVRARRSGALSNRIIPFEQDSTITTNGMTVSVIRSLDTIVT